MKINSKVLSSNPLTQAGEYIATIVGATDTASNIGNSQSHHLWKDFVRQSLVTFRTKSGEVVSSRFSVLGFWKSEDVLKLTPKSGKIKLTVVLVEDGIPQFQSDGETLATDETVVTLKSLDLSSDYAVIAKTGMRIPSPDNTLAAMRIFGSLFSATGVDIQDTDLLKGKQVKITVAKAMSTSGKEFFDVTKVSKAPASAGEAPVLDSIPD